MNTYRVTVKVESLNYTNTVTVEAVGEGLMPNGKRSDLRLRGALVTYDVVEVA